MDTDHLSMTSEFIKKIFMQNRIFKTRHLSAPIASVLNPRRPCLPCRHFKGSCSSSSFTHSSNPNPFGFPGCCSPRSRGLLFPLFLSDSVLPFCLRSSRLGIQNITPFFQYKTEFMFSGSLATTLSYPTRPLETRTRGK